MTEQRPPRLMFQLLVAERALRRWIDAHDHGTGITAAGAGVLFHLASNDRALLREVAEALDASVSGVSGLVARLERAGLLAKVTDPDDARAVRLTLTDTGRRGVESSMSTVNDLNHEILQGFSAEELNTVSRWLTHLTSTLKGTVEPSGSTTSTTRAGAREASE